uniref:ABC1 atypical kinase-like domain-containing protein n=1 Tax=Odontella aurita TaxID=265563 RepID=A0A7S4JH35_9STRA|mmetsp:Transcript_46419/g.140583  ORF Transcript_46419/g.140583 Transcript_46419/m.140583 type:complete len:985 (+) Transcript_46419:265-3219(+)
MRISPGAVASLCFASAIFPLDDASAFQVKGARPIRSSQQVRSRYPSPLSATLFSVSSNHVVDKTTGEIREGQGGSPTAVMERESTVEETIDVAPDNTNESDGNGNTGTGLVSGMKMIDGATAKTMKSTPKSSGAKSASNTNGATGEFDTKGINGNESEQNVVESSSASLTDRIANSGAASTAALATAAVNAAVAMKSLEAPDVSKSYISLDKSSNELDGEGLPLVYDKDLIEKYWRKERGALNQRWSYFVSKAVPFFTKMVSLFIAEGKIDDRHIPGLSRQARIDLQDLGPTFIKAGQMMSVRPDVLPQSTLDELTKLQDSVVAFETSIAVEQIEAELGGPLGQFFTSISEEPVAAASLAQVYLATLNDGKNTRVAVKVQRPDVLSTVSKDLYVLRRAAEVFQGLVERFAPQQKTNYVALLNEWSIGFYTELDFANEARNQRKLREALEKNNIKGVTVPRVYDEYCTRRILVSEWMDGKKLSECPKEEIGVITDLCQEAFLVQLFEEGFFHADPHPGNILKLNEPTEEGHTVALIDCGLMASIEQTDRDNMISAVIHLANKDYASLVDDFIDLEILPPDSDRAAIIPLMDKALSPYVKGGGAKKYEEELKKLYGMEDGSMQSQVGGFQSMTQDALTVLNDVPFSIPPYFAILGRAIVTLEGIALTGNPDYGIIMESYPFIARKLLREDRPEIQRALQEVLYSSTDVAGEGKLKFTRLLALLNNAAGSVETQEGAAFVDLDAVPDSGLEFADGLRYLLSGRAESLRNLLEDEVDSIVDILSRQILRKGLLEAVVALTPPRPPALPFVGNVFPAPPKLEDIPLPFLLPSADGNAGTPSMALLTVKDFSDLIAPSLNQDEEIYAIGLVEAAGEFFGEDVAEFVRGESVLSVKSAQMLLGAIRSGVMGQDNVLNDSSVQNVLEAVGSLINNLGGTDAGDKETLEQTLTAAVSQLDESERTRLDGIVSELVRRSIARATDRLSSVPRAL